MIPHVIVLEPGLVIYKIYNGYWFFGRPTIEDLRQDLRAVTRKCRPDWDITTPEMKAAWKDGRKEPLLSLWQDLRPDMGRTRLRSATATALRARPLGARQIQNSNATPAVGVIGNPCPVTTEPELSV